MASSREEIATAAMTWLAKLEMAEQHRIALYYGDAGVFSAVFKKRIDLQQLHARGGQFRERVILFDTRDTSIMSSLGTIGSDFLRPDTKFIIVNGVVPSNLIDEIYHVITLRFDKDGRTILHQDSQGDAIRPEIVEGLASTLPDWSINDLHIKQQYDSISCAMIGTYNAIAFAKGDKLDKDIHDKLPVLRVEDATIILQVMEGRFLTRARNSGRTDDDRRAWRQAVRAIEKRDPELLPQIADRPAVDFLIRLARGNVEDFKT